MCSNTKLDKTKLTTCQKVQVTHIEDKVREGSLRLLVMSCVNLQMHLFATVKLCLTKSVKRRGDRPKIT